MRPEDEVEDQMGEASAASVEPSRYPGMTYEQGVRDALSWVLEETDDAPIEVE